MNDRELMQMALDAATEELPKVDERETVFCSIQGHHLRVLCEFVRAALAQPEPEPVAVVAGTYGGHFVVEPVNRAMVLPVGMALYTTQHEPARCDDYCSNNGCNDGPACPARASTWRKRQITDQGET